MNPHSESDAAHARLSARERLAAEWVLRQANGLTASEEQALSDWLAADPAHGTLFAEMEETSRLLDGLKFRNPRPAPPRLAVSRPAAVSRRRFVFAAAGIAAALVAGVIGVRQVLSSHGDYVAAASTGLGEFKRLPLPDGSTVLLNTNTALEVSFTADERRIRLLSGEAYFAVAKNPQRPFLVQAGRIVVRAVGTAFNVRLRPDALNVLVTEGKVRVAGSEQAVGMPAAEAGAVEPVLTPGQLARVALDADRAPTPQGLTVSAVEERDLKSALAWHEGRLEFFDTPLAEVVAEFNRYNRHKIVIADAELARQKFGGAFASPQFEPLLELLEQSFGVVTEQRGNETVIRSLK